MNRTAQLVSRHPTQIRIERALVKEVTQLAEAHVPSAVKLLLCQPEPATRDDQLASTAGGIPLAHHAPQRSAEFREVDSVRARVRLGTSGDLDTAAGLGGEQVG